MRILHTSDWHLGKKLFKLDRRAEHELFLNWLVETVKIQKIDVLLMSGDVFDTPTPPHQAIELFYHFLHKLSHETNALSFFIAGNHDSGQLIEAPAPLLKTHRVKVWGKLHQDPDLHWHKIEIDDEVIELCAVPFFRSYELIEQEEADILKSLSRYLVRETKNKKILMLHHLAGMFEASGSEQVISLTGVDSIPTELLRPFDYVALGHIHKPQKIKENIYYSGSPLPMRFSEKEEKSVIILDTNDFTPQKLAIPNFRKVLSLKLTLEDYREKLKNLSHNENELTGVAEVEITLPSPQIGLIDEIKTLLDEKNFELLSFQPVFNSQNEIKKDKNKIFELSTKDLFREFYQTKYPEEKEIPEDVLSDFNELLQKAQDASSET